VSLDVTTLRARQRNTEATVLTSAAIQATT